MAEPRKHDADHISLPRSGSEDTPNKSSQGLPSQAPGRNNIAAAALAGLKDELDLKGNQFPTAVSILFVGYLLMQVPSNLFLNKIGKPAIYLPTAMVIWGVISAATAGVQSYGGLLTVRFFLGFVEAAFFNMDGVRGWRAWRWLFLIEGVITVFIAIGMYFILPNFPRTTTWLSEEEKAVAIWRLQEDVGEDDWVSSEDQSLWRGFKLALEDVKTWVLLLLVFCIVASGSITNFFPTVVKTLGYGDVPTLLLTSPPYVLCFIVTCLNSWHADRTGERYFHIVLPLMVAVAAFILAASTTTMVPRYISMMLMRIYNLTGLDIEHTPTTAGKKGSGARVHQRSAFVHNCVACFVAACAATILRLILMRLNKKLERGEHVKGAINAVPGEASEHGFRFRL
ncbi:hypothetical protein SAPIO_CDS2720 [Scedosporium apiospermum]|uniref:Major facilitator superfamily transporter n=1 Tax=Pseudallescheria apiosperma TaxID=563466 RepID=A0A084GD34_PSEDA|nr:uncharacterized protein SAPIO_CDS2720 [Scedosporium apiospermum]KEZ45246.1 hypothetical protein SAPIO_CDS2720 [Scedosporium apiospermum]